MTGTHDAIVVGGGIVGASVGYHLARAGSDVVLVDREDEGRATDAGAGILSPSTSARAESPEWFGLARAALEYYPDLVQQLESDGMGPTSFAQPGYLCVAPSSDRLDAFNRKLGRLKRLRDQHGTPAPGSVESLDASTASDLFPPIDSPEGAFLSANAGRVDGQVVTNALLTAGRSHGLVVEAGDVTRIVLEDGAVRGVRTDSGGEIAAKAVVIAGGAWSPELGTQLGVDLPVAPQRGQIAHLVVTDANTSEWPILAGWGTYIVPWDDGRLAVGATNEDGIGLDPRTTVTGVHELLEAALNLAPGLADAELADVRVGLRPTVSDRMPILGPVSTVDGAFVATGHGPTGLLLGPYSGYVIANLVRGNEDVITPSLEPFSVSRFE